MEGHRVFLVPVPCKVSSRRADVKMHEMINPSWTQPGRFWVLQDAIDRVRTLEASGELTGVMDDRGKVGFYP